MIAPASEPEVARRQRELYATLIGQFGKGWEKGKAELMSEVFSLDATFVPSPFDAPLKGRAAIELYWKDVPSEQAEVSFRFGEVFTVGPWFAVEYKCTFRRRRTGEWVDLRGALFCETAEEKISEMRMYWHRGPDARNE
jgi:hypothetical protein